MKIYYAENLSSDPARGYAVVSRTAFEVMYLRCQILANTLRMYEDIATVMPDGDSFEAAKELKGYEEFLERWKCEPVR